MARCPLVPALPGMLLGVLLGLSSVAAQSWTIEALMRMLATVPERRASFHEEKTIAALTRPVQDGGTLRYVRPAFLEKHTVTPREEDLIVDGPRLTIRRPVQDDERTLDLRDQPALDALVDAVRGTLAGDIGLLRRHFDVGLEGSAQAWRLTLTPTDPAVARFMRVVRIDGGGSEVRVVDTVEANGDSTHMTIGPAS